MNELHKVLIVAFREDSRDAAYEITSGLKDAGYSVDVCHAPPELDDEGEIIDSPTNIKPDFYLTEVMETTIYDGIIFLDDGNNLKAAVKVAKIAGKGEKALGGYRYGCEVLAAAGLLKKRYVATGLPDKWTDGADIVHSPSVRADNVVTSAGNCAPGFAALMVDALGGQVKRKVECEKEVTAGMLSSEEYPEPFAPTPLPTAPKESDEYKKVERELSYQGFTLQDNGMLAVRENDNVQMMSFQDTAKMLNVDLNFYLQKFKESDQVDDLKAKRYARIIRRLVLCQKLLVKLFNLEAKMVTAVAKKSIKTADYIFDQNSENDDYNYGEGTVPGPYSNVSMPERVIPWQEGDDWLKDIQELDEQTIANLSRYHPDSKDGFFAEFDLWHRNDPLSWDEVEQGQGDYPTRVQLHH